MKIIGVILAAGAGARMGKYKALLEFPDGSTLLEKQVKLLHESGIETVCIVTGAGADEIRRKCDKLNVIWAVNSKWERGQFSSIQSGLNEALRLGSEAVLVLPVDTVGVRQETIEKIVICWLSKTALDVVIPHYDGQRGHPVLLSYSFVKKVVNVDPDSKNARLDVLIKNTKNIADVEVKDPKICSNINDEEQWNGLVQSI